MTVYRRVMRTLAEGGVPFLVGGAYAFTLIVTLAATGEHSVPVLAARAWETLLGGVIGLAASRVVRPLRASGQGVR